MVPAWEDAIAYLFAGFSVVLIAVVETRAWASYRRKTRGLTLYDVVKPRIEAFQDLNRHSFLIRASDVTTMKLVRGLKVVRDAIELTLESSSGQPQMLRIELEGTIGKLGIESALYEAGFHTMPTQWGTERE